MILIRLILLPVVLLFDATRLSLRTVRFLGFRRLLTLGVGVGIGVLVAPVPGREMRERLRRWAEESGFSLPENVALSVPPSLSGRQGGGPTSGDGASLAGSPAPSRTEGGVDQPDPDVPQPSAGGIDVAEER